jgi:hypothetical protein
MTGQDAGNLVEYISVQGLKPFIDKDLVLVETQDFGRRIYDTLREAKEPITAADLAAAAMADKGLGDDKDIRALFRAAVSRAPRPDDIAGLRRAHRGRKRGALAASTLGHHLPVQMPHNATGATAGKRECQLRLIGVKQGTLTPRPPRASARDCGSWQVFKWRQ